VIVREALPDELAEVGELRVRAYAAQDLLAVIAEYADTLRGLGNGGGADVLVAVEDARLLGTVLVQPWGPASEIATGPDEAELRALAVDPGAQGRGVGRALLDAAVDRTRAYGADHLVLSTQPAMAAAHRLYRAAGFVRLPERDWSPVPGLTLLAFGLRLPPVQRTTR
jgi:ribosomal protein S18 acetylase RimI-like enzyme